MITGLFDGTADEVAFERSGSFLSRIERIVAPAISPAPVRAEDVSVSEDDGAEREIEAVVAAGDESCDVAGAAAPKAEPMPSGATIQRLVAGVTVQRTASGGLVIEAPPEAAVATGGGCDRVRSVRPRREALLGAVPQGCGRRSRAVRLRAIAVLSTSMRIFMVVT